MSVKVSWYEPEQIILYVTSDPLTLEDLAHGAEEVRVLASGVPDMIDMIFDYRQVTDFPRGGLPILRDGNFKLPTLERVALVGNEPLIEMMFTTITQSTFRPDPTVHPDVPDAANFLRRMAAQDNGSHA
jgi:hypothetical protein